MRCERAGPTHASRSKGSPRARQLQNPKSLEPDAAQHESGQLRQGRAIGWIEEALAPLRGRMPEAQLRRLVLAIRSATGIEARVWLTDVAGLSSEEDVELMLWSAKALYRSALCET